MGRDGGSSLPVNECPSDSPLLHNSDPAHQSQRHETVDVKLQTKIYTELFVTPYDA
jgi:hypothetical protein